MEHKRSVSFEIKTLSILIRRQIDQSSSKEYVDKMTGTNGWVIGYLAEHQNRDVFQRDMEEQFSVRRSTMSNILQLMEQKGLITREPVPYDARLKKLVLTDKTMKIHEMITRNMEELEGQLTNGLSEQELGRFFELADKIKKNLEQPVKELRRPEV